MGESATKPSFVDENANRTSMLPYLILEHKRLAARRFRHARSKENGLKHLDIRTGWLAIFWLMTFFGVMWLLLMLLVDIVTSYMAMPVATQIKAEDGDLEFPDVTVCPKSPFASGISPTELKALQALRESVRKKLQDAALESTTGNVQAAMLIQLATEGEQKQRAAPSLRKVDLERRIFNPE
ncbi:unnamed protein product [Schistocephalus solidus]|uniref:Uncharacterized protein n=1 Tax=Schistocephalus solidus TaxID=70667 RepID=A0A183SFY1_SCHSO|nr:unnamed protein product [Schistocephalus solidus]